MFFSIFKFLISFSISFTILCIPINNKPIFSYIYTLAGGHAVDFYDEITDKAEKNIKIYASSIFDNTPNSIQIKNAGRVFNGEYSAEEKELLLKVLNE